MKIRNQEEVMMTEWNVQRIVGAVALILFIIWLPFFIFSADSIENELKDSDDQQKDNQQVIVEPVGEVPISAAENSYESNNVEPVGEVPISAAENNYKSNNVEPIDNSIKKENISNLEPSLQSPKLKDDSVKIMSNGSSEEESKPQLSNENIDNINEVGIHKTSISSIVESDEKRNEDNNNFVTSDKIMEGVNTFKSFFKELKEGEVSRALLSRGMKNREPIDKITSSIHVGQEAAIKLYYFTEIIDMEGQTLYHHWIREGESIFKREIKVLGRRWRASTNKFIQYFNQGEWKVVLENEDGVVLNEIQFEVIEK
ncbi:MAG: DUF2914 domain-containing protein [Methylococcales bacterium]|nr:DUF2914 domain-containing protein [Methylococcales bacterium]